MCIFAVLAARVSTVYAVLPGNVSVTTPALLSLLDLYNAIVATNATYQGQQYSFQQVKGRAAAAKRLLALISLFLLPAAVHAIARRELELRRDKSAGLLELQSHRAVG